MMNKQKIKIFSLIIISSFIVSFTSGCDFSSTYKDNSSKLSDSNLSNDVIGRRFSNKYYDESLGIPKANTPEYQLLRLEDEVPKKTEYATIKPFLKDVVHMFKEQPKQDFYTIITSSIVYPNYFMKTTNDKSEIQDLLKIKDQAKKAFIDDSSKNKQALKDLLMSLNNKYN